MEEIKNTIQTLARQIAEYIISGNISKITISENDWYNFGILIEDNPYVLERSRINISVAKREHYNDLCCHNDLFPNSMFNEWKDEIVETIINKYNEEQNIEKQAKIAELERQLKELKGE